MKKYFWRLGCVEARIRSDARRADLPPALRAGSIDDVAECGFASLIGPNGTNTFQVNPRTGLTAATATMRRTSGLRLRTDSRDGDMTAGDQRIVVLRAKVRDERALLGELSARVSPDIQKLLKPAFNLLDDVEGFFLAHKVLRDTPRNEAQMTEWLGHAGNVLRRAIEHREQIERLTKDHGPDAKVR